MASFNMESGDIWSTVMRGPADDREEIEVKMTYKISAASAACWDSLEDGGDFDILSVVDIEGKPVDITADEEKRITERAIEQHTFEDGPDPDDMRCLAYDRARDF